MVRDFENEVKQLELSIDRLETKYGKWIDIDVCQDSLDLLHDQIEVLYAELKTLNDEWWVALGGR